jgi:hypothetical protein
MKLFRSGGIREEWSQDPTLSKTAGADELESNPLYDAIKDLPVKLAQEEKAEEKVEDKPAEKSEKAEDKPEDKPAEKAEDKPAEKSENPFAEKKETVGDQAAEVAGEASEAEAIAKVKDAVEVALDAVNEAEAVIKDEEKTELGEGVAEPVDAVEITLDDSMATPGAEVNALPPLTPEVPEIPGVVPGEPTLEKETCAAVEPKFEKFSKLSPKTRKLVGEYFRTIYPSEYVDAMVRDYEA